MFSKTCEYAIRATIIIASESQLGNKVSLREIARKIDSPESFTAKILQKLAKNKLVESSKGNGGGFFVSKEMLSRVKLGQIVLVFDGDAVYNRCSLGLQDCSEIKLPYITVTPVFSVCAIHGYLNGEHEYCPTCDEILIEKLKTENHEHNCC